MHTALSISEVSKQSTNSTRNWCQMSTYCRSMPSVALLHMSLDEHLFRAKADRQFRFWSRKKPKSWHFWTDHLTYKVMACSRVGTLGCPATPSFSCQKHRIHIFTITGRAATLRSREHNQPLATNTLRQATAGKCTSHHTSKQATQRSALEPDFTQTAHA